MVKRKWYRDDVGIYLSVCSGPVRLKKIRTVQSSNSSTRSDLVEVDLGAALTGVPGGIRLDEVRKLGVHVQGAGDLGDTGYVGNVTVPVASPEVEALALAGSGPRIH